MQKTSAGSSLGLMQRIYIIASPLRTLGNWLVRLLAFNLFFLSLGWIALFYNVSNFYVVVYLELSLATIAYLVYYLLLGPSTIRHLKVWIDDYLEQTYTVVFNTTVPTGSTTGEKILSLAREIFPELMPEYVKLSAWPVERIVLFFKKKFGKSKEVIISQSTIDSYLLDLVVRITLDGVLVIKEFKGKAVTPEDLNYLIHLLSHKFRRGFIRRKTNIFRLICVAKSYDDSFLNRETLENRMTIELKANFKIDLIMEEEVGYSVLWVGR